jgi:hypothetical protein
LGSERVLPIEEQELQGSDGTFDRVISRLLALLAAQKLG